MAAGSEDDARPADAIATSRFSTREYEPGLRLEAARAYTSPFFELTPATQDAVGIEAVSTSYLLHDLVLNETTYGAMRMERPDRRRLTTRHEFVTVWLILEGRQDGIVGEAPFRTRAGELHLFDGAPAMRLVSARPHVLSAHIPYAAIRFDPSRHGPHLRIAADTAMCHVVSAMLRALHARAPTIRLGEAEDLSRGLCSLLRAAFRLDGSRPPDRSLVHEGRALAMRAFLDERLRDPAVGVDTLCRRFNVSRATVYRVFAEDGGVGSYLRRRRLERVLADLAASSPRRGLVRRVAEGWGFDDPSHFHRLFRERFGMSPVEAADRVRASSGGEVAHRAVALASTPVFDWLATRRSDPG